MIAVILDREGFEYDIHSLVKAFYPASEVKVFLKGSKELVSDTNLPMLFLQRDDERAQLTLLTWQEEEKSWKQEQQSTQKLPVQPTKSAVKNVLKQLLYQELSLYTGQKLPWGTLTGIRPTKIAMGLLEQGWTDEEILRYMQETYYVSEEKGRLGISIAQREKALLSDIHYQDGYSVYIGIPFCPTTCLYCSFTSYPICVWKEQVGAYLLALEKEIDAVAGLFSGKILDSIYIGGGTPTTLEAAELERLLHKVRTTLPLAPGKEFTVEAGRADSITKEKLLVLKKYGVTRISVNPQTMKEETSSSADLRKYG